MSRIWRLLWWPARTRRERWIWRYGYVWGVTYGIWSYRRIYGSRELIK